MLAPGTVTKNGTRPEIWNQMAEGWKPGLVEFAIELFEEMTKEAPEPEAKNKNKKQNKNARSRHAPRRCTNHDSVVSRSQTGG